MQIPNLMDPVRNFAYEEILEKLGEGKTILDVGCRDSGFPGFLSSIGHKVTAIDRMDFSKAQEAQKKRFNTEFAYKTCDLMDVSEEFDVITAVYALQHNIEHDIDCYRHCARLAKKAVFIVNEYDPTGSNFQYNRDDGDMRRYCTTDIFERIIHPMSQIKPIKSFNLSYGKFVFETQHVAKELDVTKANTFTLEIYYE